MPINAVDFEFVRGLVREGSAIALEEGKAYLAEARLDGLARREGFASLDDLIARARGERGRAGGLRDRLVEAMTTNESSFFRDVHPFEALRRTLIPELILSRCGARRLRIWSAACSSGQEPYTIAMILREHFGAQLSGWDVQILASDLSTEMLDRARAGRYTQMEVNRGVPATLLVKNFRKEGSEWRIIDEVRSMVEFRRINLDAEWPSLPALDLVFLRNVLIYFEAPTRRRILERMAGELAPDGHLFLGGSETTLNYSDRYERRQVDQTVCYRPRSGAGRPCRQGGSADATL